MKKLIFMLVVILTLCVLWFEKDNMGLYSKQSTTQQNKDTETTIKKEPSIETVVPTTQEHEDWKTYTDPESKFSIQYPSDITPEVLTEDQVIFQILGKTQKPDTEFYDGLFISIEKKPFRGKSLLTIVTENQKASYEIWGEPIGIVKEIFMGGYTGYTYDISGHTYWYLTVDAEYYLEILNLTSDPEHVGFTTMAEDMVQTFQKE